VNRLTDAVVDGGRCSPPRALDHSNRPLGGVAMQDQPGAVRAPVIDRHHLEGTAILLGEDGGEHVIEPALAVVHGDDEADACAAVRHGTVRRLGRAAPGASSAYTSSSRAQTASTPNSCLIRAWAGPTPARQGEGVSLGDDLSASDHPDHLAAAGVVGDDHRGAAQERLNRDEPEDLVLRGIGHDVCVGESGEPVPSREESGEHGATVHSELLREPTEGPTMPHVVPGDHQPDVRRLQRRERS
jgi:hypothetical protein